MNRIRFNILPEEDKKEHILKKIALIEESNNITIPRYAFVILTGDIVNLWINCAVCWFDNEKNTNDVFERNKQYFSEQQGVVFTKLENKNAKNR